MARLNTKRVSINLLPVIISRGKVRFEVFKGSKDADIPIDFMKRLIKGSKRKVFRILDNLRVHHAEVVKAWLRGRKERIEVFYLPWYSPVLNLGNI